MSEMPDDLVVRTRIQRAHVDALLARRIAEMILDVRYFGDANGASDAVQRVAVEQLLAVTGWRISDLSVPQREAVAASSTSDARVCAMSLGLAPWPSASGWAPADLPWAERRILIGIVEGIASLTRIQACSGCGKPMCGYMNESVCPLCKDHVCGASLGALCSASNNNVTVAPPPRIILDPGRWDNGCPYCQGADCVGDC